MTDAYADNWGDGRGTQYGMHSIRETCGVLDTYMYLDLFGTFYNHYEKIDHTLFDR